MRASRGAGMWGLRPFRWPGSRCRRSLTYALGRGWMDVVGRWGYKRFRESSGFQFLRVGWDYLEFSILITCVCLLLRAGIEMGGFVERELELKEKIAVLNAHCVSIYWRLKETVLSSAHVLATLRGST